MVGFYYLFGLIWDKSAEVGKMKAIKFLGNKKLEIINRTKFKPKKGCALVKVMIAGICRTDIELLYNMENSSDITPSHEISGIIEDVNEVKRFKRGYRVIINCHLTCGICDHCKKGDLIFCKDLKTIGFDIHGGDAEYVVVPEDNLRKLPNDISFDLGTIISDALGTPYHAVKKAGINKDDIVGIIGMGPLGLMAVICVKYFGGRVVVIDMVDESLKQAKKFGADVIINTLWEGVKEKISRYTKNNGLDFVLECSGSQEAINLSFDLLKCRGKLILIGVCTNIIINPYEQIVSKEIEIVGSRSFNNNGYDELFDLVRKKPDIKDVISHRFSLDEAERAFRIAEERKGIKIILNP